MAPLAPLELPAHQQSVPATAPMLPQLLLQPHPAPHPPQLSLALTLAPTLVPTPPDLALAEVTLLPSSKVLLPSLARALLLLSLPFSVLPLTRCKLDYFRGYMS
jgi:hypothetical protein